MNSFEQQGVGWERQISFLSGRPPAKVSQSQTIGCRLHLRRPFLFGLADSDCVEKWKHSHSPSPFFCPPSFLCLLKSHLLLPFAKKITPITLSSSPFIFCYCYHFFHLNLISQSFIYSFAPGLGGVFPTPVVSPSGRGAALFSCSLSFG